MAPRLRTFFQPRDLMFLLEEIIPKAKTFCGGLKNLVDQTSIIYDMGLDTFETHNIFNILFFSRDFSFSDSYMKAWDVIHERSFHQDEELILWLEFTSNMLYACQKYHLNILSFSHTWIACPHWKVYLTRGTPILLYWLIKSLSQFPNIHEEISMLILEVFPWDSYVLKEFSSQKSISLLSDYRSSEHFQSFLHQDLSSIWLYFLTSLLNTKISDQYKKKQLSSQTGTLLYHKLLSDAWLDLVFMSTRYQESYQSSDDDSDVVMMLNTISKVKNTDPLLKDYKIMDLLSWACNTLKLYILNDFLLTVPEKLSLPLFDEKNMFSVFVTHMSKHSLSSPLVSFAKSLCNINGIIFTRNKIKEGFSNQHMTRIIKGLNPAIYPSHREFLVCILESATDLIPWYLSSCKISSNLAVIYYSSLLDYYFSMLTILNKYPQYWITFLKNKFVSFHVLNKVMATERSCMSSLTFISSLYSHVIGKVDDNDYSLMEHVQENDVPSIPSYISLLERDFVKNNIELISMLFKTLSLHCKMTFSVFPSELVHLIPFSVILSQDNPHSTLGDVFTLLSTGRGVDWFLYVQDSFTLFGVLMEYCLSFSIDDYSWMSKALQCIGYHESDQETLSWCYFHDYLREDNLLSRENIHSLFIPSLERMIKNPFDIISLFNEESDRSLLLGIYIDKLKELGHSMSKPGIMYTTSILYGLSMINNHKMMQIIVNRAEFWNNITVPKLMVHSKTPNSILECSIESTWNNLVKSDLALFNEKENIIFQSIRNSIATINIHELEIISALAGSDAYFGFTLCQLQRYDASDPMLIHFGIMLLYSLEISNIWTDEFLMNACFEWFIAQHQINSDCSSLYFYLNKASTIWNNPSHKMMTYCSKLYEGTLSRIDRLLLLIMKSYSGNESAFDIILERYYNPELLFTVIIDQLNKIMVLNTIIYSMYELEDDSNITGNKMYNPKYLIRFLYEFIKRFKDIDFLLWFPKFLDLNCLSFIVRCLPCERFSGFQCLDMLYTALSTLGNSNHHSQFRDIKWFIYYLSTAKDAWSHMQASICSHIAQVLVRFSSSFLYLECANWMLAYPRLDLNDIRLYERLFYYINDQINVFDSHSFRMFILESMMSGITTSKDVCMIASGDENLIDRILLWNLHSPLKFCPDSQISDILLQERIKIGMLMNRIIRTGHNQLLISVLHWMDVSICSKLRPSPYIWDMYVAYITILESSIFSSAKIQTDVFYLQQNIFINITKQVNDIITTIPVKGAISNEISTVFEQKYARFLTEWWYFWNKCHAALFDATEPTHESLTKHLNILAEKLGREAYHHLYLKSTGEELYLYIK